MPAETTATTNGGKEKRTRRRLRVSCVECTKRRQTPCGLCVSRGVPHLCKWENHPVARPAPARPPQSAIPADAPPAEEARAREREVQALKERITSMERTIIAQNDIILAQRAHPSPPRKHEHQELHTIPPEEGEEPVGAEPIGQEVQEAAMALAQLSLGAHHGGGEYYGRGTVVHALHSSSSPSPNASFTPAPSAPLRALVAGLPVTTRMRQLLGGFFEDVNWRFGLPQAWFLRATTDMACALAQPGATGLEINVHWLCLLFAVLALSPQGAELATENTRGSERFFALSLAARRLAKDLAAAAPPFVASPHNAPDGTVLSSLAAPLLCAHLAEMGRVSEAWKLLGSSIRAAQAVGLHRDVMVVGGGAAPEGMGEEERVLRATGWWGLVVWDRLYSFVLGRPTMIRRENVDVLASLQGGEGGQVPLWRAVFCEYQTELVKLSDIVAEAMEKCLGPSDAPFSTVFEVDQKFQVWEDALPEQFRWRQWYNLNLALGHLLTANSHPIEDIRRCYLINTWYLACRMNLHRSYLTQVTTPSRAHSAKSTMNAAGLKRSHEECISLAIDLLRLQCITHDSAYRKASRKQNAAWTGNNWAFELCYYLFDAGVTLMSGFGRMPVEARAKEAQELVDRSVLILEEMGREYGSGPGAKRDIAMRAVDVLNMLGRELGWRSAGDPGLGAGIAAASAAAPRKQQQQEQQQHQHQHQQHQHQHEQHQQQHQQQQQPQHLSPNAHSYSQQQPSSGSQSSSHSQSSTPPVELIALDPTPRLPPSQIQHAQMLTQAWPSQLPPHNSGHGNGNMSMHGNGAAGMHSYGFVPQPPLPVPMDASNSTPLSRFFAAPHMNPYGASMHSMEAAQGMTQGMVWGHLQDGVGEYWS
ncbi:hypothetical protein HWV62_23342 [Athelia sp. TMB]|nr:hypothetical protein HWV62_23342 [Athelia sp. TMB]